MAGRVSLMGGAHIKDRAATARDRRGLKEGIDVLLRKPPLRGSGALRLRRSPHLTVGCADRDCH